MKKVIVVICIFFGAVIAQGIHSNDVAQESGVKEIEEGFVSDGGTEVQVIRFEPMEIKANVTFMDFTDEPPMEIIVDPNEPITEEAMAE